MLAVDVGSVTFTGEEHLKRYTSSEWADRGFCTECGSNLFYFLKPRAMYIMCAGCFDDEEQFALSGEIFIDEKPAGYNFAGEHPRQTGEELMASLNEGG